MKDAIKIKVEKILKNFTNLRAKIKTIESRIHMLNELLSLEDLSEYYQKDKTFFKKPLINRPTETQAIAFDDDSKTATHKLAVYEIKKEINRLKSEKITKENIVDTFEISFKALTKIQNYIVEAFFFNKMTLENILSEIQKHPRFKKMKVWSISTIVNYKNRAIDVICSIVRPYIITDYIVCLI